MIRHLAALLLLLLPRLAGAWGAGHDDVARAVMARLPAELRASLTPEIVDRAIRQGSHYPDSFQPFLPEEVGEKAIAALNQAGVKVRHDLHLNHGRVASFAQLVEAFREGDPAHIAHWISSHSHVIADMAACNHDPIVHTATYGWGPWKVKLPHSGDFSKVAPLLDLAGSGHDPGGGAEAFDAAATRLMLRDDGRDAAKEVQDLLLYGQDGARFCASRGVKVLQGAAAWIDTQDPKGREMLWQNMGELGAWAVVRTLRDVEVARRFAKDGTQVALTPEAAAASKNTIESLVRERHLDEDALFAPVLRELQPGDANIIGIVLEPTWEMNEAMLGFSSRVQAAAIARTLRKLGRPHATFDVRRLAAEGFPPPGQVPLMIVVAPQFTSYHGMKTELLEAAIAAYLQQSGRVLWIMGHGGLPKKALAPFTRVMQRPEKGYLPVPAESFTGSRLIAHVPRNPSWRIANTPETPAGWQKPLCPWRIEPAADSALEPLLTLESDGVKHLVGACTADHRLALIPIYAVTPYLLEGNHRAESPAEPELDEPSTQVLLGVMETLLK